MIREIDLLGVYVSPMLAFMAAALLLWLALRRVLERTGAYRYVWHRPLFDVALYVVLLGAVVLLVM
ncbi:MAG: DUF1656 domain-containing protein [Geminicoccaceae bacterium]